MPFLLLAGAVGVLFFAIAQLPTRNKQPIHYCMIMACLSAGYILLYFWAVETGLILSVPVLVSSDISAIFWAAPSFYLAALTILHEGRRPVRSYAVYFIAPVLFAISFGAYNAITAPAYLKEHGKVPSHFSSPALMFLTLAADLAFAGAVVLDLLAALRLRRSGRVNNNSGFRHQVAFLFCYLAASFILLSAFIFRDDRLFVYAALVFCVIILAYALSRTMVYYFTPARSVQFFRQPRPEWDDSSEELAARLQALMEGSAPYRDPRLYLGQLARLLGVAPKRLSYHLHASLSVNFRGYINEWRLKAICRDLLEHPDHSILDIALENGFNSKSSFNTLFFRKYGRTPREFRKENLKRRTG
jgi:AraC-like DNA-binding protein